MRASHVAHTLNHVRVQTYIFLGFLGNGICARADPHPEAVFMLLEAGADPNDFDELGNRPLHLVSCSGRVSSSRRIGITTLVYWHCYATEAARAGPSSPWAVSVM